MIDLRLPQTTGFEMLEQLRGEERFRTLPVIIHTGKELEEEEKARLRQYAQSIVLKSVRSPDRLLDETSLYLHRPDVRLSLEQRQRLEALPQDAEVFEGKKVLVVDDDMRNVFALASTLESRGMQVVYAENGRKGIEQLEGNPDVALVLMDIMMPEMDGYETTRALRSMKRFEALPIISLTAGASDYITKPVNVDQLLSLMRVWLRT